jgi:hypothetical protein
MEEKDNFLIRFLQNLFKKKAASVKINTPVQFNKPTYPKGFLKAQEVDPRATVVTAEDMADQVRQARKEFEEMQAQERPERKFSAQPKPAVEEMKEKIINTFKNKSVFDVLAKLQQQYAEAKQKMQTTSPIPESKVNPAPKAKPTPVLEESAQSLYELLSQMNRISNETAMPEDVLKEKSNRFIQQVKNLKSTDTPSQDQANFYFNFLTETGFDPDEKQATLFLRLINNIKPDVISPNK